MVIRHLRGQYKQSVLGYAWAFLNPLSLMIILSFVFSTILRVPPPEGEPFPLFLFVGLVPWLFFSSALASGTDSVTNASSLVSKVYFPREVLPTAAVLTKLVDLFFGMIILVMLMAYYGRLPEATIYWFPLLFGIHMIFTLGLVDDLVQLRSTAKLVGQTYDVQHQPLAFAQLDRVVGGVVEDVYENVQT